MRKKLDTRFPAVSSTLHSFFPLQKTIFVSFTLLCKFSVICLWVVLVSMNLVFSDLGLREFGLYCSGYVVLLEKNCAFLFFSS